MQQALIWWLQNIDGLKSTCTVFERETVQHYKRQICKNQKRDFLTLTSFITRGNHLTLRILLRRSLEELAYSASLQLCFHWHARSLTTSEALTPLERILSIPRGDAFERTDVLRLKRPPTQTATLLPLYICFRSINNCSQQLTEKCDRRAADPPGRGLRSQT